jgi:hypothetical protein
VVRNDQEARGKIKQVACHDLPLVYSRISAGTGIVPLVTKVYKR